jgi:hypothetical protein
MGHARLPDGQILFSGKTGQTWDVFLYSPHSGHLRNLTNSPEPEGNPIWWAPRKLVVFSRQNQEGLFELSARNLAGTEVWSFSLPGKNLGWPVPSPWDNRILAISEDPGTGFTTPGIVSFPEKSFVPLPVSEHPAGQAAWVSPTRLLLSRVYPEGFSLCRHDLETSQEKVLVSGGNNWLATAAPHGGAPFFFTRRVGQVGSIFRLIPGADEAWTYENETQARAYDWQPSVTPDSRGLLFLSLREGTFRLILRSLDDQSEQEIPIPGINSLYHPTWILPGEPQTFSAPAEGKE